MAVDIAGFTRPDRDGDIQFYLHRSLYDYVKDALEAVGIPWEACYRRTKARAWICLPGRARQLQSAM